MTSTVYLDEFLNLRDRVRDLEKLVREAQDKKSNMDVPPPLGIAQTVEGPRPVSPLWKQKPLATNDGEEWGVHSKHFKVTDRFAQYMKCGCRRMTIEYDQKEIHHKADICDRCVDHEAEFQRLQQAVSRMKYDDACNPQVHIMEARIASLADF